MGNAGASGTSTTGGSSSGGSSTGGACSVLDFDFRTEPDEAVAYQIDPAHTGAQLATRIEPPFGEIWRHEFDAGVSYPVIAGSKAFVAVNSAWLSDQGATFGAVVHAIDLGSGSIAWSSELQGEIGGFYSVHLAYDRGVLFAANGEGTIVAYEPESGATRWRTDIDEVYAYGTMPIAAGGAVFYTGATVVMDQLFVLDECDGAIVYRAPAPEIGHPTLGAGLLFGSSGCNETEAMDARDGSVLWHYEEDCFGSGGWTSVFHDGILYVGEDTSNIVALDANSGDRLATLDEPAAFWPLSVAEDGVMLQSLYLGNYALKIFDPRSGAMRWSVALPAFPRLPVLATPGYALVLAGGEIDDKFLYAVDLGARDIVWRSPDPTVPYDSGWVSTGAEPRQAMAAGGGKIVVAYNGTLVAYAPVEAPECGDAEVEGEEACDDGNTDEGDYCSAGCDEVTGRCGDGIVQNNETCDGPTGRDDTSCSDACQITFDGVMLAAGNYHTCGLRSDGSVTCWGSDFFEDERPTGSYRYISANENFAAGVLLDGSPTFWGGWRMDFSGAGPYTKLEAGLNSFCALDGNGLLECMGGVTTPTPARRYSELSMFSEDFCAVTADAELFCFHEGVGVPWGGSYRSVAVGGGGTCAIRDDRTISCSENAESPSGEFVAVTAGSNFWCGIRTNGDLACWGNLNARSSASLTPPAGKFALIDAGWQHVCGVRIDGTTVCFGANDGGQATPPSDFP